MITGTEIYWITRMSYLQSTAMAIGILSSIGSAAWVFGAICTHFLNTNGEPKMLKAALPVFVLSFIILFSSLFIPSTKEMCAIKVLPVIINNEDVQGLPNKVVDLANEWLEELKPNKEN